MLLVLIQTEPPEAAVSPRRGFPLMEITITEAPSQARVSLTPGLLYRPGKMFSTMITLAIRGRYFVMRLPCQMECVWV